MGVDLARTACFCIIIIISEVAFTIQWLPLHVTDQNKDYCKIRSWSWLHSFRRFKLRGSQQMLKHTRIYDKILLWAVSWYAFTAPIRHSFSSILVAHFSRDSASAGMMYKRLDWNILCKRCVAYLDSIQEQAIIFLIMASQNEKLL